MNQESELIKLVKDVFGQEPGTSLLKELELEIQHEMYDDNPYKVYYRLGKMDLIKRLRSICNNAELMLDAINQQDNNLSETGEM